MSRAQQATPANSATTNAVHEAAIEECAKSPKLPDSSLYYRKFARQSSAGRWDCEEFPSVAFTEE